MSFSKSRNCTRRSGSYNFSFLKNSLVQINSKLNSKPYDYLYKCFSKMISLSIILCLFIITVGLSTAARQLHKLCFQFSPSGPSLCATVDFLVLEVFNSNNLSSEAVVGLKLFYPKSFRKQFCAFLKAPNFI